MCGVRAPYRDLSEKVFILLASAASPSHGLGEAGGRPPAGGFLGGSTSAPPVGGPGSPSPSRLLEQRVLLPHLQHPLGTRRHQRPHDVRACAYLARPGVVAEGSHAARVRPGTCWPGAWLSCARKCATKSGISVGRAPPRHRARQDVEAVEEVLVQRPSSDPPPPVLLAPARRAAIARQDSESTEEQRHGLPVEAGQPYLAGCRRIHLPCLLKPEASVVLCAHGERAWTDRSAILPRAPCGRVAEGALWDATRMRQERPHGRCGSRIGHGGLRSRSLGGGPLGTRISPSAVCACWTVRGSALVRWAMRPRTGSMLCCRVLEARPGRWPAPDHAWGRGRETCAANSE